MLLIANIGEKIAQKRRELGLSQTALAKKAHIGRSTLDALENGRMGELGYTKINNLLSALGLELRIQEIGSSRPTLEELMGEESHD